MSSSFSRRPPFKQHKLFEKSAIRSYLCTLSEKRIGILSRVDEKGLEFAPYARTDYRLIVDTGEPNTWFYGQGFGLITDIEKESDKFTFVSSESWQKIGHTDGVYSTAHLYRKVLPTPKHEQHLDEVLQRYYDGTAAYVKRWGRKQAIPALFPCYDLKTNKDNRILFFLPRILALAVDPILAARPYEGILGLNMLEHGLPIMVDMRNWKIEVNDPSGSSLYLGDIWPCAVPTSNSSLVPKFTDEIALYATTVGPLGSHRIHYVVEATLVTLYVPKHPEASHWSTNPQDWTAIPIVLRDPAAPLRLILDSCASHSYFPPDVVEAIATKWLENDPSTIGTGLYCKPGHGLDKCDLVFRFVGVDGLGVDYRCNAGPFLTSPWSCDGGVRSLVRSKQDEKKSCYILGMPCVVHPLIVRLELLLDSLCAPCA
ncbi:hypothetical protein L227DRAFT_562687 [Lentinus tigrinus ALCF2SS1-6]|uniref:Peptidase A1 domain-containing protein n=1 Tax=Lentinus tigrinus ALCF2SS1-6 TaxID=1328759 RepID=A0A5C2SER0_9APHY|nr:hypothetical protein L227DRAFT_562687 [Lentinus tigrinus ALCF2SS1-6]